MSRTLQCFNCHKNRLKKEIAGSVTSSNYNNGQNWIDEHFVCFQCKDEVLPDSTFKSNDMYWTPLSHISQEDVKTYITRKLLAKTPIKQSLRKTWNESANKEDIEKIYSLVKTEIDKTNDKILKR